MTKKPGKDWKKFKEDSALEDAHSAHDASDASCVLEDDMDVTDDASAALAHPSYVEMEEKLTLAEQRAHENWEKSVRAMAELDNVRRRAERDVEHAHRFSLEKFSVALLPVVDSLEQALHLAEKEANTGMHEGLALTMQLLLGVLHKFDVKPLDPLGEAFNPQWHEAMSMQPSADVPPNTVLTVFQKGYTLNDRVIRPARVVVSKESPA